MKIYAPVKDANGTWASVRFVNGVGETNDPRLIDWFRTHGYKVPVSDEPVMSTEQLINTVIDDTEFVDINKLADEPDFDAMTPNELREWMRANGYAAKIKNIRDKNKLLNILRG